MYRKILIFIILYCNASNLAANLIPATPTDFRSKLSELSPGDTMLLASGSYTQSLRCVDLHGSSTQPIVIASANPNQKAVFLANSCCNTVSLTRCSYLVIEDLYLNGQNLFVDAVKAEGSSGNYTHDITLQGLEIYNYGANQQAVGISTKCPSWNWIVRKNIIDGAGTGMYFGNSDGEEPFVAGLIEYNLVKNTIGYNCQIKHQNVGTRNTALGMPRSAKTIVRYNVFSKAQNASSGSAARPNLLVGNFPASGDGTDDYYEIYGNFFYQNPHEGLFQGTGNIGFYNNVLWNSAGGWGIAIQNHVNFAPRDIDLFYNTLCISGSSGLNITGSNNNYTQRAFANAVFANSTIIAPMQGNNIFSGFSNASDYLKMPNQNLPNKDLSPLSSSLDISNFVQAVFSKYENYYLDFEGFERNGEIAGAYKENRVWQLQLNIRMPLTQAGQYAFHCEVDGIIFESNNNTEMIPISGNLSDYNIQVEYPNGNVYQNLSTTSNLIEIDYNSLPQTELYLKILHQNNNRIWTQVRIK